MPTAASSRFLLTIAGHDPVHGAGITADLATWAAMGLDGASVVTALTVQNSSGLASVEPVSSHTVARALQAVLQDGEPQAVKIGMPGSIDVVRELIPFAAARNCPVVFDPVLAASNGQAAFNDAAADMQAALRTLISHVDVVTPNVPEARVLLGLSSDAPITMADLNALGAKAVVLKGGHGAGEISAADWVLGSDRRCAVIDLPRLPESTHGTGCVYSSALAGAMAQGWDVYNAAVEAKLRVHAGIAQSRWRPGRAHTRTNPVLNSTHLPRLFWLKDDAMTPMPDWSLPNPSFSPLIAPLGFYPVVPDVTWVKRLLDWGVRTVQLRVKADERNAADIELQIDAAARAGQQYPNAQVFINDHWRQAIAAGAYGVHLGQEDVEHADLNALRQAGLRLGLSSHTPAEMARAHALQPSYLAIGPIYPTTLKVMSYEPVGLMRLREWTRWCKPRYPLVAIGGISLERAADVWASGVDSVAVVSAITQAVDPEKSVRQFLSIS